MKQTIWTCDICNKPLKRNHGGSGDLKVKLKVKQYDGIIPSNGDNFDFTRWTTLDICDDCRHDMVMWIKYQKEREAN
jgi:ribosomal protein S27E